MGHRRILERYGRACSSQLVKRRVRGDDRLSLLSDVGITKSL